MSRLIVRNNNETEETETMQVIETSNSNVDISEQSLGDVKLECARVNCHEFLIIGRNLGVNLICPQCGDDNFLSHSNFRMERPDGSLAVHVGDQVHRRGKMIWKLV